MQNVQNMQNMQIEICSNQFRYINFYQEISQGRCVFLRAARRPKKYSFSEKSIPGFGGVAPKGHF